LEPIADQAARLGADEIVVAISDRRGLPVEPLVDCRLKGIRVTDYLTFWERMTGKVVVDALDPSWLAYCDGFVLGNVRARLKRLFDLCASLVLLVLFLPAMLGAALAVRLDSPGPILFRQIRVG